MAECIEREAAIRAAKHAWAKGLEPSQYIEALPTADVAPVVRCKDCKWFADNNDGVWYGCQMLQVVRNTPEDAPKPDDYCSYGERKDGGADHG